MIKEELRCLQLAPFRACGFAGSCETNGTFEICECAAGWSQSREQTLFFATEKEFKEGVAMCNSNGAILVLLYVLVLSSAIGALFFQAYSSKTLLMKKRFIPFISAIGLQIILAIYRLSQLDHALLGDDVLFSFMVGNAAFLIWWTVTILNKRYFDYVSKRLNADNLLSKSAAKRHERLNSLLLLLDIILYQQIWIVTASPRQNTVGIVVIKTVSGIIAIRVVYYGWTVKLLLDVFVRDMETLLELSERRLPNLTIGKIQTDVEKYISKKLLPRTIRLQKAIYISASLCATFLFICSVWDLAFLFYPYLYPLNFIAFNVATMFASSL